MEYTNEENWIDLSKLPRLGGINNKIKWNDCYDINVSFKFKNFEGILNIIKPLPNRKMLVEYSNKQYEIYRDDLRDCKLTYIVGLKTHGFKKEIDEIIKTRYGHIKIVQQFYKKTADGYKSKAYKIQCLVCGENFEILEDKLMMLDENAIICPVCRGDKIKIGYNDMWATDPIQAKLLKDPNDGHKYTRSTPKTKLKYKCPYCGNIIKMTPNEYNRNGGLCCPKCSESISYPNKYMFCLLQQLNIEFENELSFSWSNGRKYDFYIKSKSTIIEMNGIQHYEDIGFNKYGARTLKEEQENDLYKKQLALNNGIKNYIVIDCKETKFNYITNNVLNSKLKYIIDLNNVDYELLKRESEHPHVKLIADLWNSGIHDIGELMKITNIKRGRLHTLLVRATELGLCNYDPNETFKIAFDNSLKTKYQIYSKPAFCNEYNLAFGNETIIRKVFEDNFNIKLQRSLIHKCLTDERKHTNKLTFKYITKQEFNDYKNKFPNRSFGEYFEEQYLS